MRAFTGFSSLSAFSSQRAGGSAAPVLAALTLSSTSIIENTAMGSLVGAILGATHGSSLSLVDNSGNRFALSGGNIVAGAVGTNFEAAASHQITLREVLAGAPNSPRDTTIVINVTNVKEQPSLSALTLSSNSATQGSNSTINVVAATVGSTIAGAVPDGMVLNSAARTISGTPTTAGTYNFSLTETLADSPNSPRVSNVTITVASAPTFVTRNAVNMFGPGHSTGSGRSTSTGTAVNSTPNFVNRSGAPITTISLVFSGWWLTTTGTSPCGNDYPITATIEFPVGTPIATMRLAGNATITVPNGTDVVTDQIDISATPIPAGSTFRVSMSTTTPNGQFYITSQLGLTGVLTTAMSNTLRKEMLFTIGDSIITDSNAAIHTVAATANGCPSFQMSIGGTRAQSYAASTAAFARQLALAKRLGATRFVCNFGTNDFDSGARTLAQLQADLNTLRNAALAEGIGWSHATLLPRTFGTTVTASLAVGSGNTITLTVPNASLFDVGHFYLIAGAVETGYNNNRICISRDLAMNTVTFLSPGVSGSPATGTITITKRTSRLQTPVAWEATRVAFNAWVRSGALGPQFLEWADSVEPSRDAGRWATCLESPLLVSSAPLGTVTSIITTSRFNSSGTAVVGNGAAQGVLIWASGPNIGLAGLVNGSNNGDITLVSTPASPIAVGHTFYIESGTSLSTNDGVHPRIGQNGRGGQEMIVRPSATWLAGLLA